MPGVISSMYIYLIYVYIICHYSSVCLDEKYTFFKDIQGYITQYLNDKYILTTLFHFRYPMNRDYIHIALKLRTCNMDNYSALVM